MGGYLLTDDDDRLVTGDGDFLYWGEEPEPEYSPRRLRRRPTSFDLGAAL